MRRFTRLPIMALLVVGMMLLPPSRALAQGGTDIIREYDIDIQPQDNGDLINTYTLNWCVISDAAGPLSEIYVGMPNAEYEVLEYKGDAEDVQPANTGVYSQVVVSLDRYINAGECVSFTFSVRQKNMAHLDEKSNEIGFQFIPGWFDDVPVEKLKIAWGLPADESLLKSIRPGPTSQENQRAVWESTLDAGDKFTINILYDRSAFPNFGKEGEPIWPLKGAVNSATENSASSAESDQATTLADENRAASSSLLFLPSWGAVCTCAVILIVLVIVILLISLANGVRGYSGGGYIGRPRPTIGGMIFRGGGSAGSSRSIPPSRSGGGGGLFGGRGSSCACVSCACACACAGGGRAGCSRKGFDISTLKNISEKNK